MRQLVSKIKDSQMGAYLQFLALLLIVAAMVLVIMSMSACDTCDDIDESPNTTRIKSQGATFQADIKGTSKDPTPGGGAVRWLGGETVGATPPDKVTYIYHPPQGATAFVAIPAPEPGGPPYVWKDQSPTEHIIVNFDFPNLPAGKDEMTVTEIVQSKNSDGTDSAAALNTTLKNSGALAASPQIPASPALPRQDEDSWLVGRWIYTKHGAITMTTSLCQDWVDFLQSDAPFMTIRLPMASPVLTQSYPIPIIYGPDNAPFVTLLDETEGYPGVRVVTASVEYRPERFDFAENNLPSAPGEHWAALGISSNEPLTCPDPLSLVGGDWEIYSEFRLDLDEQERTLELYFCYEGQDQPLEAAAQRFAATSFARALGGDAQATSFQGEGITCVGPYHLLLADPQTWEIHGTNGMHISPTMPISLHHSIYNHTADSLSVNLDYAATVGSGWKMCGGTWDAPDPSDPLTNPLTVYPHDMLDFWLLADTPAGTEAGPYTVDITATLVTSPTDVRLASDFIWVGEWTPPPGGTVYDHQIYLPLVVKSH